MGIGGIIGGIGNTLGYAQQAQQRNFDFAQKQQDAQSDQQFQQLVAAYADSSGMIPGSQGQQSQVGGSASTPQGQATIPGATPMPQGVQAPGGQQGGISGAMPQAMPNQQKLQSADQFQQMYQKASPGAKAKFVQFLSQQNASLASAAEKKREFDEKEQDTRDYHNQYIDMQKQYHEDANSSKQLSLQIQQQVANALADYKQQLLKNGEADKTRVYNAKLAMDSSKTLDEKQKLLDQFIQKSGGIPADPGQAPTAGMLERAAGTNLGYSAWQQKKAMYGNYQQLVKNRDEAHDLAEHAQKLAFGMTDSGSAPKDSYPSDSGSSDTIRQAKQAIAQGADPQAVAQRLKDAGIDPSALNGQ